MASIGTRLFSFFKGKFVGNDQFGNRYYENRSADQYGKRNRWVIYKGIADLL